MTDRIDFGGEPWRAIPRSTLRDPRLSLKARGALTTLLSHDEGWVRSVIATLMHESTAGRASAQAAMKELVQAGYATWERRQDPESGQFRTSYIVFAISQLQGQFPADSPQTGNPSTDYPQTDNHAVVVEALDEEALDVEPTALIPRAREKEPSSFDAFYDFIFPRKAARPDAERAWTKALKRATAGEIIEGAIRYRDDPNREDAYTAHPATWLNRDGWNDGPLPPRVASVRHHDRAAEILREAQREQSAGESGHGPAVRGLPS